MRVIILVIFSLLSAVIGEAKSLYVIAEHHIAQFDAWNIEALGQTAPITYQATYNLSHAQDPAGVAIDNDSATLFITSENDPGVELVDATTMTPLGWAPGATNLAGIDIDERKKVVYAVERGTGNLYVYDWDSTTKTLTLRAGYPKALPNCSAAFGLALDENRGLLYVADTGNGVVRVYDVATLSEVANFAPSFPPVGLAIDRKRGFVYTTAPDGTCAGGTPTGNTLLSKYDLATGVETTVDMGHGGMGIAVDEVTGYVYVTGGCSGDDISIWDSDLNFIYSTGDIGNPAGIAIGNVSYNPLNLAKNDVVSGYGVYVGQEFTYKITFGNSGTSDVTGVKIVDTLPPELDFVSESLNGAPGTGVYDPITHTVTWNINTLPVGYSGEILLKVRVNQSAIGKTVIYNYCTIESDQTPPTTVIGKDPDNPTPGEPGTYIIVNQPPDTRIETADIDPVKGTATFTWSGTDDTTPVKNLVYSYRLAKDSVYSPWSDWSSDTGVTYTDLEPGNYRFQVRAKDANGAIDPSPASKDFAIGPGTIKGRVTSAFTGKGISGAMLILDPDPLGYCPITDSNGFFSFSVPPDIYTVTAKATGYGSETKTVIVNTGQSVIVNFAFSFRFVTGTGVHPEEGTPETDFYYTAIIDDAYGRKPSLAVVNIDGRNYAMEYMYEDLAGFHYRYGPIKLDKGEHHYSFHFRIGDRHYWYPGFGEALMGPIVNCPALPDNLVKEADLLEQTLIGDKIAEREKGGGLIDQAANGTAERTAALVYDFGKMLVFKYMKHVLQIPSKYDRFKEKDLRFKEGFLIGLNGIIKLIEQLTGVSPAEPLGPFFESAYRNLTAANAAERKIDTAHDAFLESGLCMPTKVDDALEFLAEARRVSQLVFDHQVGIPFAGFDTLEVSKTAVTYLQLAAVIGGAVLTAFSGGSSVAIGVSAAAGLEKVKLGLRLSQALVVGVMWGLAPTFVNDISSVAGLSYNLAGQAVETGEVSYPDLECVSLVAPDKIRFGEVKPATVVIKNPSALDVKVQLYAHLEVPINIVPPFPFKLDFPVGDPVEIKSGEKRTFTFPVFCPPSEMFALLNWVFPKTLKVSCYAEYGYLAPHGKRVDINRPKTVVVEPPVITVLKDAYSHIEKLGQPHNLVGLRFSEFETKGLSFEVVLTVVNHTDHTMNVTVRDRVPEWMDSFTVQFETPPDEKSASGREFSWILSLRPEEQKYLRYTVFTTQANEGEVHGMPGAEVQFVNEEGNTQTVKSAGTIDEVYKQQVQIERIASLPRSPQVDEEFKVVAEIGNPGPDTVNNVIVSVRLPRGLDCVGENSKVIESISAGGTATVEWDVKALEARVFNIGIEAQASGYAGDLQILQVKVRNPGEKPLPDYYISLAPNPVSSDGCVFHFNLPENIAQAKLMIFNVAGRLLFETSLDVSATRFPSSGTWNPVDQNGVPLANGPYIYVLVADGKVIGQGKMVIQR